ncbi:MAG: non-canonical purine NTP diphosphatase [Bacteroides sp.]|nr:non-canonical purine NTP diphosphatase [Bacteroides sp.]
MKKRKLVFATNNLHKLEEVAAILGDNIELLSLKDIHCDVDIPETADTLEGNALLKSEYVYNNYGLDAFADDTGLEIEALNNEPGVYSARYAGEDKSSQANMLKVLDKLQGVENRKAQFRTVISLLLNGKPYLFEGIIQGKIIEEKRGEAGFGYDPIFMPDGFDQTFAELGNEIKNKISHRAIAVNKLCEFLKEFK